MNTWRNFPLYESVLHPTSAISFGNMTVKVIVDSVQLAVYLTFPTTILHIVIGWKVSPNQLSLTMPRAKRLMDGETVVNTALFVRLVFCLDGNP